MGDYCADSRDTNAPRKRYILFSQNHLCKLLQPSNLSLLTLNPLESDARFLFVRGKEKCFYSVIPFCHRGTLQIDENITLSTLLCNSLL